MSTTEAKTYFKIACDREQEMAGAGLGYEEIFGGESRYFWERASAESCIRRLNHDLAADDPLKGSYFLQWRTVHEDGSFEDDADNRACKQLGI